jgi:hypothetical protein
MNDRRRTLCFSLVLTANMIGCGSTPPPVAEAPVVAPREVSSGPVGPSFESEIGALDDTKVKQTFEHLSGRLTTCFTDGARDIAFMSGDVRFVVRVAKDGSARWVYVKDSTLGHRKTEECMTSALKAASWPKPLGGEGLAENSFSFDPGSEERPPVAWTPERLGPQRKKALARLDQCKKKAGTRSLKATMYIDTDGSVSAVGLASGDEKGQGAADCVVDALKSLKYPSPGSYAAKVTVATE